MKNILAKIYAKEMAGFSTVYDLEEVLAGLYGYSTQELRDKYTEITEKINATHNYTTNQEFGELIYKEYMALFNEEGN